MAARSPLLSSLDRRRFVRHIVAGAAGLALGRVGRTSAVQSLLARPAGDGARRPQPDPNPCSRSRSPSGRFTARWVPGSWSISISPPWRDADYGIQAVEYVNTFFKQGAADQPYLMALRDRCEAEGVRSVLIMCDGEGRLGDPDAAARTRAVENHFPWVEAARLLGCHSIRVNAASEGSWEEQRDLAADGLRRLAEFGDTYSINVIVENHGGLSSNAKWLTSVIEAGDHPRLGTLPDFGNFRISESERYDNYEGVRTTDALRPGGVRQDERFRRLR